MRINVYDYKPGWPRKLAISLSIPVILPALPIIAVLSCLWEASKAAVDDLKNFRRAFKGLPSDILKAWRSTE